MTLSVTLKMAIGFGLLLPLIKYVVFYVIRIGRAIAKRGKKLRSMKWTVKVDWKDDLLLGVCIVISFVGAHALVHFLGAAEGVASMAATCIFIAFLTSYNWVLRPMIKSFTHSSYTTHKELQMWVQQQYGEKIQLMTIDEPVRNAYATGILPFGQHILLGQPLLKKMQPSKLKAIILHEIGHLKQRHLIILFISALVNSFLIIAGFSLVFDYLLPFNWIGVMVAGALIGLIQYYGQGIIQRQLEYRADAYAAARVGVNTYTQALTRLHELIGLESNTYAIDHPSLEKRIAYVEKHC